MNPEDLQIYQAIVFLKTLNPAPLLLRSQQENQGVATTARSETSQFRMGLCSSCL